MTPKGSCWVWLKSMGGGGGQCVRRGSTRVDPCVPLIVARSGRIGVVIVEKTFDEAVTSIASGWVWLGLAGLFRLR